MFLDVYCKLFFFLFVWLLVKLWSQSINKTIGSYKVYKGVKRQTSDTQNISFPTHPSPSLKQPD